MDLASWKAMLERRGYQVTINHDGGDKFFYEIADVQRGHRSISYLRRTTYKGLRKQIDDEFGHGMQHCVHTTCGFPLLKARRGYTRDEPFYDVEEPTSQVAYYAVPYLYYAKQPLLACPRCGGILNTQTVHRVSDPEEFE